MKPVIDIITAVLLCGAVWLLLYVAKGKFVTPVRQGDCTKLTMVVSARDDAPGLEQAVRGLIWLRDSGSVELELLIADAGLCPEGKSLVENLQKKYENIGTCRTEDVGQAIGEQEWKRQERSRYR